MRFQETFQRGWTETEKFALKVGGTFHGLETQSKLKRKKEETSTSIPFFRFLTEDPLGCLPVLEPQLALCLLPCHPCQDGRVPSTVSQSTLPSLSCFCQAFCRSEKSHLDTGCTLEGYTFSFVPLPALCHFLKDKKEEPGMVMHTQRLAVFLCYSLLFPCLKFCLRPTTMEPATTQTPNMGAKLKLFSFRLLFLQ